MGALPMSWQQDWLPIPWWHSWIRWEDQLLPRSLLQRRHKGSSIWFWGVWKCFQLSWCSWWHQSRGWLHCCACQRRKWTLIPNCLREYLEQLCSMSGWFGKGCQMCLLLIGGAFSLWDWFHLNCAVSQKQQPLVAIHWAGWTWPSVNHGCSTKLLMFQGRPWLSDELGILPACQQICVDPWRESYPSAWYCCLYLPPQSCRCQPRTIYSISYCPCPSSHCCCHHCHCYWHSHCSLPPKKINSWNPLWTWYPPL